jgi:F0F1-type ATP synthase assembly protein I
MDQNSDNQGGMGGQDWRRWTGLGIEFGGVIAIFCYMGYLADKRFGTGPWLFLTGFFLAFIGMMYLIFKQVTNFGDKDKK